MLSTLSHRPMFRATTLPASAHASRLRALEAAADTDPAALAELRALSPLPVPAGGWSEANIEQLERDWARLSPATHSRALEAQHTALSENREWAKQERRRTCVDVPAAKKVQEAEPSELSATHIRKKTARPVGGVVGVGGRQRAPRSDRGVRRATTHNPTQSPPQTPEPTTTTTTNPGDALLPNVGCTKRRRLRAAYLPADLVGNLPLYRDTNFTAAMIDLVHVLATSRKNDYTRLHSKTIRRIYGRASDQWAWDRVREDAKAAGLIEVEKNSEGTERYCAKKKNGTGLAATGLSKGYRLCEQWRGQQLLRVPRGPELQVKEVKRPAPLRDDGSAAEIDAWLLDCLEVGGSLGLQYDIEGAVRYLLERAGAVVPADLDWTDYDACAALVSAGTPTAKVLAETEARREKPQPKNVPTEAQRKRKEAKRKAQGKQQGKTRTDTRTSLEILRTQILSDLGHLHRWLLEEGGWTPFRDTAGLRLHSGVTGLSGRLRRFLTFRGEPLVCVDVVNSQMTFVAEAAYRACPTDDALEFWRVCGAGKFYELSYQVVHGRAPTAEERKAWKPQVMRQWLFAHGADQVDSEVGQALSRQWPFVHNWMATQKITGTRDLPVSCQRRESSIWIDQIGPALAAAHLPVLTIHDSALIPASRADECLRLVQRIYSEAGLLAQFKVEAV